MKNWLLRVLPKGAKRVHDWLKYDLGEPPEVLVTHAHIRQLPADLIQYREQYWRDVWTFDPGARGNLSGVLDSLRPHALVALQLLGPLEVSDVHRASRCFSATTAVGVDHWHPRSILDLPKGAVLGSAALLNQCEQGLMWPTQTLLS
eukprot:7915650-Pyramimonas_sp.AAC.1